MRGVEALAPCATLQGPPARRCRILEVCVGVDVQADAPYVHRRLAPAAVPGHALVGAGKAFAPPPPFARDGTARLAATPVQSIDAAPRSPLGRPSRCAVDIRSPPPDIAGIMRLPPDADDSLAGMHGLGHGKAGRQLRNSGGREF